MFSYVTTPDTSRHREGVKNIIARTTGIETSNVLYDLSTELLFKHVARIEATHYGVFSVGKINGFVVSVGFWDKIFIIA